MDISESILEFVLCMLTGCDKSNQLYLIDNKFPEMVVDFMKMYQIKDLRNKANMAKRDRLLEEVSLSLRR